MCPRITRMDTNGEGNRLRDYGTRRRVKGREGTNWPTEHTEDTEEVPTKHTNTRELG
jgi:hypothetical protein